jgi:hypothetical protein
MFRDKSIAGPPHDESCTLAESAGPYLICGVPVVLKRRPAEGVHRREDSARRPGVAVTQRNPPGIECPVTRVIPDLVDAGNFRHAPEAPAANH